VLPRAATFDEPELVVFSKIYVKQPTTVLDQRVQWDERG
jgi:hypothetical protein